MFSVFCQGLSLIFWQVLPYEMRCSARDEAWGQLCVPLLHFTLTFHFEVCPALGKVLDCMILEVIPNLAIL